MSSLDFSRLVRAARPLRACARWRRAERYGTLHSRSQTHETAANLFARRALWEAAVTSYWRTANSGRRQQQITELLGELGDEAEKCHKEIEVWRNQHVAHRVADLRERVDVRLSLNKNGVPKKTIVRVAPVLGPRGRGQQPSRTRDVPCPCAEGPGLGDANPAARISRVKVLIGVPQLGIAVSSLAQAWVGAPERYWRMPGNPCTSG